MIRLAPDFLADPALQAVLAALPHARLVGGCVRDAVLNTAVTDIDLATPDPPDAVIAALAAAKLRAVPTGLAHGTITAISGGRGFEVTTLRRDLQTDGRHATVAFSNDWQADAERRDFTFNALSMERDGTVFDYFDGIADLHAGRVRFVGDPATRIAEDRLRVLRFFRFFARFAAEPPDQALQLVLAAAAPTLNQLSAERVWSECKRILATPAPLPALRLMQTLGILAAVLPEATDLRQLGSLLAAGAPADPLLRLAALIDGDAAIPAARLRLSGAESARLLAAREQPAPGRHADEASLRRLLADTPRQALKDRAWLTGAPRSVQVLLTTMPRPIFPLAGRDGLALGMTAGPALGGALLAVRRWWLAGGCLADRAACLDELARLGRMAAR